jgi:tRNA1Val (adenine37-N6)-methyltransferase
MKVCTDSCLFGAWVANEIGQKEFNPKNILDIGTGTGLLSLMLAQKTDSIIDAVEINDAAYMQAHENFTVSPWNKRLKAFHSDIKNWQAMHNYDLIICNPPFFENDLLPVDEQKNISKHSHALNLKELLFAVQNLLSEDGSFAVLLPSNRATWFESKARSHSLFPQKCMEVKQTIRHNFFRTMFIFKKEKMELVTETISIKNDTNHYSPEFIELLKDYYL